MHDLSVVGNVKGDLKETVQFKTANIKTNKGRTFADRYRVPHVTLLLFDGCGTRVNIIHGVTPSQDIRVVLGVLANRS